MEKLNIVLLILFAVMVVSNKSESVLNEIELREKVKDVSLSNDKFSMQLYDLLRKLPNKENLVFSPFSLSTVLAMLSLGAKQKTLKQMKDILFFPSSPDLLAGYKELIP